MTSWRERKLIVADPIIGRKAKTKGSSNPPHLNGVAAPSIVPDEQPLLPSTIIAELTCDDVATAEGYIAKLQHPCSRCVASWLMLGLTRKATRRLS